MKKFLIALLIIAVVGGVAWFILLRPETVSQETVTADFKAHQKAYEDVAYYLHERHIRTEFTDIPMAGHVYEGIVTEDTDEYRAFMQGWTELMSEDHDVIRSDGETVEFVYHSTGGVLNRLYGSVIYNGTNKVEGRITVPLTTNGWHLFIAKE